MNELQNLLRTLREASQSPARKVFFSFHYKPDVSRAWVVRNSWVTKEDRTDAGFFDASVFEAKQRESEDSLKAFLREGLKGTSVTCVLIGTQTALRPWVRYELVRSFHRGNGLFGIRIHEIADFQQKTATPGSNPFDCLAYRVHDQRVYWQQLTTAGWQAYTDVPSMALSEVAYDLNQQNHHTFACRFPVYDWVKHDGYTSLSTWVQRAAIAAGK
jgi:hypothetical protein